MLRTLFSFAVVVPSLAFPSGCSSPAPPVVPAVDGVVPQPAPPALGPPAFCWLAFGPKNAARVLVTSDGRSLRLDDRAAGAERTDLFPTPADCKGVTIRDPDGRTRYIVRAVEDMGFVPDLGRGLEIEVEVEGPLSYWQAAQVRLGPSVEGAPVVRFHAPLSLGLYSTARATQDRRVEWQAKAPRLTRGHTATLNVQVQNWAPGTDCKVVVESTDVRSRGERFPVAIRPVAEIEFPPARPGDAPVRRRYALNEVCCGCNFYGMVAVPTEVGAGVARVTLSFDAWGAGRVHPAVIELPVTDAPPTEE
jgi:hypothetical protein